jgi:hypothetical protein
MPRHLKYRSLTISLLPQNNTVCFSVNSYVCVDYHYQCDGRIVRLVLVQRLLGVVILILLLGF